VHKERVTDVNRTLSARFEGRTALVTGAASGIGLATARRLADEGAVVLMVDRNAERGAQEAEEIRRSGGEAHFEPADLASEGSAEIMAERVLRRLDALHALINCAGVAHLGGTLEEAGVKDWDRLMDVNLKGQALVTRALLPLLKRGRGAIVNVLTDGVFGARKEIWIYDASKAGLWSLTKSMAVEFAGYGIRVNAVAPGPVITEMHFARQPDPEAAKKEMEEMEVDTLLLRRLGRPEEIASAVAFLSSNDASYITGATLCVDGGGMTLGR